MLNWVIEDGTFLIVSKDYLSKKVLHKCRTFFFYIYVMKYLKKYESNDFNEIEEQLKYIFLDLTDSNIEVKVKPTYAYRGMVPTEKIIGFNIYISKSEKIRLSDIYMYILTSMDYMRINKMILRAIKSDYNGPLKNTTDYFYDYMSGDVPDISFNNCIILFE